MAEVITNTGPEDVQPDQGPGESSTTDIEQAKNPTTDPQFLQIEANPKRAVRKKPEPKLTRVAFKVSRLMEFCSLRELQNQTGHAVHD
jgi:hypothetical protein